MELRIDRAALRRLLARALGFVILAGLAAAAADELIGLDDRFGLIPFFGLSYEGNLPTWVSSLLLATSAALLAGIALGTRQEGGRAAPWWGLAAVFAYISLDELARLHEGANRFFDQGGVLYFGWVIPAAFLLLLLGLLYLRFLLALPRPLLRRFVLAAAAYVGGALGVELLLGWWTDRAGDENFVYALIDWVEESLEMIGVGIFVDALLGHLAGEEGRLGIDLPPPRPMGRGVRRLALAAALSVAVGVGTPVLLEGGGVPACSGETLEEIEVTLFTVGDAKEAGTEVHVEVRDGEGHTLLDATLPADEALPGRSTRTMAVPLQPAPLVSRCGELRLAVVASQPTGDWSWETKLWVVGEAASGARFELVPRTAALRFGSRLAAASNRLELPLRCERH